MSARRLFAQAFVLGVCVLGIVSTRALIAASSSDTRAAFAEVVKDNARWKKAALDREAQLVKKGDECLKDKDYNRAREYYKDALEITYSEWLIPNNRVAMRLPDQKRQVRLNSESVRRKLESIDAMELAGAKQEWKQQAVALLKQGDAAMAQKDPGRAYDIYTRIVNAAEKDSKLKDAATADQAKRKQQEILKTSGGLLDEAEKLLAAGNVTGALDKLNDFLASYGSMLNVEPDLKGRAQKFSNDPAILKETQEQAVRKEMVIGDEALMREDYVSALRRYRLAASMWPDTVASREAAEKVAQMQNDPKIVEGLKKQDIESRSRLLFLRAETLRTQGNGPEAAALYQEIVSAYPDSSYAAQSQEALEQLGPQPAIDISPAAGGGD